MDPLVLIIYWLPVLLGEPVVLPTILTGEAKLMESLEVLPFRGVVPSVSCELISAGLRENAQLCAPRL